MLLMIDNYDSFTFNLVQYFGELGEDVRVFRNDEITLEGISELKPDKLVLSPGPCSPAEAGICVDAIKHAVGAGDHVDFGRRRDHGRAAPRTGRNEDAARRRAISSRVDPERARARD